MNWKIYLILFCSLTSALSDISTAEHEFPEPDPPFIERGIEEEKKSAPDIKPVLSPAQEWIYHKTSDNQHPDGNEQQMMWFMNRARSNPQAEGIWLSGTGDSDVNSALTFFGVNITVLQNEFASYDPKPPGAFDRRLYNAAKEHSEFLISTDSQNHNGQFDRVTNAGFNWKSLGGNVFSYAKSPLHGHAGFNVDWGSGDNGMQTGRGHRINLMSIGKNFYNVGKAVVQESNGGTLVGPLVITENYSEAFTSSPDHYNNFIVGTVWTDSNGNSQYDPGEGKSGVTATPDSGTYFAVTADSGGYAIPVTSQSISTVKFSGTSLGADIDKPVSVGLESVLLDVETGSIVTDAVPDIKANGSGGTVNLNVGNNLSVVCSLDSGSFAGRNADWWVAVDTPSGWYYFNVGTMLWELAGSSHTNLSTTYQGSLFDLSPFEVLNMSGLPVGKYTFYFAVDTNMDGILSFAELFFGFVIVNISP